MRIVHEIDDEATVSVGIKPYSKPVGEDLPTGLKATILILVEQHGIVIDEQIYIDGNAKHILKALREIIETIEECAEEYVKCGELTPDWKDK